MKNLILKDMKLGFDPLHEWEKHLGYHTLERKGKKFCGKCGCNTDVCTCNIKRKPLEKNSYYKTKRGFYDNSIYYMTTTSVNNMLMIRYFLLSVDEHIGTPADNIRCHEVFRYLINEKGNMVFARKDVKSFMYSFDYVYESELSVRKQTKSDRYDFNAYADGKCIKPKWLKYLDFKNRNKINKELRKNGAFCSSLTVTDIVKSYISNPTFIETMCKCNRYDLLALKFQHKHRNIDNELMMMLRKGRKIPGDNWFDYVVGLKTLGMDTKNIDVLDPKDFETANKTVERRCRDKQSKRELAENIALYDKDYLSRVEKLSGIEFGNNKYSVMILPNVEAFYFEGKHMCHCVYRMGYYKKDASYIFSIRNKENKRLETAEIIINNDKLAINQCYGYGDKFTEYHDEIIKLLKSKLKEIRSYL